MSTKTSHRRAAQYTGRRARLAEIEAAHRFAAKFFVTTCPPGYATGARTSRLNPQTAALPCVGTTLDPNADFGHRDADGECLLSERHA